MKLVLVEWVDSHGPVEKSWRDLDEIRDDNRPLIIRSVGWLLAETKHAITVLPHIYSEKSGAELHGQGDMVIPRKAILKRSVLRKNG